MNAVLRSVAAAGPPFPESDDLAVRFSYPDWIVAEVRDVVPRDELEPLLAIGNEPAAVTLRPNPRRTTADALAAELEAQRIRVERGSVVPDALVVSGLGDPAELAAVVEGRATPQDQGSQAVMEVLDPQPGDRVLDVAAAPGGKATAAAERVAGGFVVAADLHPGRLGLVRQAITRLGLGEVAATVVADGRSLPVAPGTFDRVLVDAPCTGLGVLRRRPEARWRLDPRSAEPLAELQRALLRDAATAVRPGGLLLYSVCTLTRAETTGVAGWAAANLDGFAVAPAPGAPWEPAGAGARLLPHRAGTDGMFVCAFRRV